MTAFFKFFSVWCIICLFSACSSGLTEDKVKAIVEETFSQEEMLLKESIEIGLVTGISESKLELYRKLEAENLVTIEKEKDGYSFSFTDLAEPYVLETKKKKKGLFSLTRLYGEVRTCYLEVDKVEDIHEVPSDNTASARITFKKIDKTPFFIFSEDKSDFKKVTINLYKTTDGKWKLLTKE